MSLIYFERLSFRRLASAKAAGAGNIARMKMSGGALMKNAIKILLTLLVFPAVFGVNGDLYAEPSWARKYNAACTLCHTTVRISTAHSLHRS